MTDQQATCECGGSGWLSPGPTLGYAGHAALIPCGCAATARQRADRMRRLGDELGELADRTFDSFQCDRALKPLVWERKQISVVAQQRLLADAHRRALAYAAAPRGWLYLHGAYGGGKSHLAAAIANAAVGAGRSAHFLPIGKLLDRLTASLRDGQSDALLDDLISCELLVLDELAVAHLAEAASDWRFGRLERLINERLGRPTVITANVAPDDLAAPGDLRAERIADRIAGAAQAIWMPISSYRRLGQDAA